MRDNDRTSESQAESKFDHIAALMQAIAAVSESGETIEFDGETDCDADRLHEIATNENPLEVSVRSGWVPPMDVPFRAEEYLILLCTGGPAVRIIGVLNNGQPDTAVIEHQDWGTCWTALHLDREKTATLLRYAMLFYFTA